jgi:hypothetical protein
MRDGATAGQPERKEVHLLVVMVVHTIFIRLLVPMRLPLMAPELSHSISAPGHRWHQPVQTAPSLLPTTLTLGEAEDIIWGLTGVLMPLCSPKPMAGTAQAVLTYQFGLNNRCSSV